MSLFLVLRIVVALLGVLFIGVGCFLWDTALGFAVSGVSLVAVSYVWQYFSVRGVDR